MVPPSLKILNFVPLKSERAVTPDQSFDRDGDLGFIKRFCGLFRSRGGFIPDEGNDPDLIIRPSGEIRTSNFLLWQSAYSEYYFTDTLWPDFDEKELDKALIAYNKRSRRFGGV